MVLSYDDSTINVVVVVIIVIIIIIVFTVAGSQLNMASSGHLLDLSVL